jgi:hypothetical protein
VKKCTASLPPQDYAFGLSRPRDPEGAREGAGPAAAWVLCEMLLSTNPPQAGASCHISQWDGDVIFAP